MPAATTTTTFSKLSRRSKKDASSSFNVKAALSQLMSANKAWSEADSKANTMLYGLLGEIYEAFIKIGKKKQVLVAECARCTRIKKSKMFKVEKRSVPELLIAYTLGNENNEAKRSQWKKTLLVAKREEIKPSKMAFVKWLDDAGGIEGVITKGKQKATNKAAPFDFDQYVNSIDPSELPLQLPSTVDLSTARSFSDSSFVHDFALLLIRKTIDADSAKPKFAIIDVVNDKGLLTKAAEKISSQNGKTH